MGLEGFVHILSILCLDKFKPYGIGRHNFYLEPNIMGKVLILGRLAAYFTSQLKEDPFFSLTLKSVNYLRFSEPQGHQKEVIGLKFWIWKITNQPSLSSLQTLLNSRNCLCKVNDGYSASLKQIHQKDLPSLKL